MIYLSFVYVGFCLIFVSLALYVYRSVKLTENLFANLFISFLFTTSRTTHNQLEKNR